ncbi:cytochrome c oxidase assembly protein COX19-like [Mizuhopecten yessoensis]|uniref:Cytochrome c oxidase assembly protein COX19 n=1 Tax=Mizuhopecten yessoensis TaxID=6573 RepID=A0A210Q8I4_MIZYE|nr:cytochrome c oxidase assembly protein COX19-like [Mizuhopecten yessoensis]OWF45060.1 Cytochrome c oxidase assembly protein COX19 [Mizuhopecten yessoensis]
MSMPPRRQTIRPPDKGSFPLDREGECTSKMSKYMTCLKQHKQDNDKCRLPAKDYLECRMNNNLMAKESWSKLGYKDLVDTPTVEVSGKS